MFERLFKRSYYVRRHMKAPLLAERINYLEYLLSRGTVFASITSTAQYLLRVVEFLQLKDDNRVITLEEIEIAANKWARYKSNNPAKNGIFSMNSKIIFTWYAKDLLKKINRIEPLPEESIPLFNKIFERSHALKRHTGAPLLSERLQYLTYWADNGCSLGNLRRIAQYLLVAINLLNLYKLRMVSMKEININNIKHYGPHSLRHACATHLINEGVALKEISDHLGHQGLDTTGIYSKVDLTNLRKVADMNWRLLI